jgi:hypothetical protein
VAWLSAGLTAWDARTRIVCSRNWGVTGNAKRRRDMNVAHALLGAAPALMPALGVACGARVGKSPDAARRSVYATFSSRNIPVT